jgi:hypothetical protein
LKLTLSIPSKLVPVIVTVVRNFPLVGVKLTIVGGGGGTHVKSVALVAVPPGVVMAKRPVDALVPIMTVYCVALTGYALLTGAPLSVTAPREAGRKLDPVIVTVVLGPPLEGVKPEIVGAGHAGTVKLVALVAEPDIVSTRIGPEVAPVGTDVTSCVPLLLLGGNATTPLK